MNAHMARELAGMPEIASWTSVFKFTTLTERAAATSFGRAVQLYMYLHSTVRTNNNKIGTSCLNRLTDL